MRTLSVLLMLALSAPALAAGLNYSQPRTPEERLQVLERKASAQQKVVNEQMQLVDTLRREIQELRGRMELQTHTIEALKARMGGGDSGHAAAPPPTGGKAPASGVGAVEFGIQAEEDTAAAQASNADPQARQTQPEAAGAQNALLTPGGALATGAAQAEPPPAAIDPAREKDEYQTAFKILMQREYTQAAQALDAFLDRYPASRYADNAQYWLAEAHYASREFPAALAEFQKVAADHPNSPKVPDALLKSGYIHYEMQQWAEANRMLDQVVRDHPGSTAARLARQRLDRMRREGH